MIVLKHQNIWLMFNKYSIEAFHHKIRSINNFFGDIAKGSVNKKFAVKEKFEDAPIRGTGDA